MTKIVAKLNQAPGLEVLDKVDAQGKSVLLGLEILPHESAIVSSYLG